jgi:pyruvate/2-oxoglutarate dehydrogenase complex dihydrolipoamide acyltransferase (E2) component
MDTFSVDPWAAAENPALPPTEIYGQVLFDLWFCVLEKGTGKRPFDPAADPISRRRTAINMTIVPLPDLGYAHDVNRNAIAESAEWKTTLTSIQALGRTPRDLNDCFVKVRFQGTGRSYTNGKGETKEATVPVFLAVYPDEAACRAAYLLGGNPAPTPEAPTSPVPPAAPAAKPAADADRMQARERETAVEFAKALITQAGGDAARLATSLAAMPIVQQHLSAEEINQLVAEQAANTNTQR